MNNAIVSKRVVTALSSCESIDDCFWVIIFSKQSVELARKLRNDLTGCTLSEVRPVYNMGLKDIISYLKENNIEHKVMDFGMVGVNVKAEELFNLSNHKDIYFIA